MSAEGLYKNCKTNVYDINNNNVNYFVGLHYIFMYVYIISVHIIKGLQTRNKFHIHQVIIQPVHSAVSILTAHICLAKKSGHTLPTHFSYQKYHT